MARAVWSLLGRILWLTCLLPLARAKVTAELLMENLVIAQNTSLPWPSSYLTKTVLKVSFLLHDPSNFFKTASFLYSWDFGNGTQLVTSESVVYCSHSIIGTLKVKLKAMACMGASEDGYISLVNREGVPRSISTWLWEAGEDFFVFADGWCYCHDTMETLQGIQVLGPTTIQTFQKLTVTLNFLGSPPLTLCWCLKSECLPLEEGECHPVSIASTAYNLTHIFHEPGEYCFSVRAENVISKTHQYHRIHVRPSSLQPAIFAFPCATLITVMLAFIMYTMLRNDPQQKDMVEVADFDFSSMSDKNPEPSSGLRCCCQLCCGPFLLETPSEYLEVIREHHGLLLPLYKPVKTYTV